MTNSVETLERLLLEWSLIYGRKMDPEAIAIWVRMFSHTPPKILALALDRVTQSCERMPTPATLQKAIDSVKSELGTGFHGPTATDGTDRDGVPCVFWSDEPTVPAYAAQNCREGRMFLGMMSDWKTGQLKAQPPDQEELQKRKTELLRQEEIWRKRTGVA